MTNKRTSETSSGSKTSRRVSSVIRSPWSEFCWPELRVLDEKEEGGRVDVALSISFERDSPRRMLRDVLEEEFSLLLTRLLYQQEEKDLRILFDQVSKGGPGPASRGGRFVSGPELLAQLEAGGVSKATLARVRRIIGSPRKGRGSRPRKPSR